MSHVPSPLQNPDFRKLVIARFCAVLASTGMVVILGYQLYDLARGTYHMTMAQAAFQLGIMGLVQFLPYLLLSPVSGLVSDRFDRRRIAALAIGVDVLIATALGWATAHHMLSLPLLYIFGALHGSARVFFNPALSPIAPMLVSTEQIPKAVAMMSMSLQVGSLLGPTLSGLLYGIGPDRPYWFAMMLLALCCIAISTIRKMPVPPAQTDIHPMRQMAEGFHFVWSERLMLGCVSLDLFAVLLGGATALLPVFARDILHVGPQGLGLMRAAPGLGAALMAASLSWRPIADNVGSKMLLSVVGYGLATIGFGLSTSYPLSVLMLVLVGATDMISVFIRSSLVQLNTPDAKRGRVTAINSLAVSASNELGEMQSGLAAAAMGAVGAVLFGGISAIVITGLWAWIFPELIRARTFAPQFRAMENHDET